MEMLLTILLLGSGLTLFVYMYRKYQVSERRRSERRNISDRRTRLSGRRLFDIWDSARSDRRLGELDRRFGAFTRRRFLRREVDISYAGSSYR